MSRIYHYCGHIISKDESGRFPKSHEDKVQSEIEGYLTNIQVSSCYGSLASGADIMLAEALVSKGAKLHIVLPFDKNDFIEMSVAYSGKKWITRFNNLLNQTQSTTQIYYIKPQGDEETLSFAICTIVAMGLSLVKMIQSNLPLKQIAIWDRQKTTGIAGTFPDMLRWQDLGLETTYISSKQPIETKQFGLKSHSNSVNFDINIYDINNLLNFTTVQNIEKLKTFIQTQPYSNNYFIDLSHQRFGKMRPTTKDFISDRALGFIAYHCNKAGNLLNHSDLLNNLINNSTKTNA